jgi:exopolysaccharide biosynthesis protein
MVEAMNLDGGGSSTLWSKAYGVVSHPCDNRTFDHEGSREVSSTLIVKAKKQKKQKK